MTNSGPRGPESSKTWWSSRSATMCLKRKQKHHFSPHENLGLGGAIIRKKPKSECISLLDLSLCCISGALLTFSFWHKPNRKQNSKKRKDCALSPSPTERPAVLWIENNKGHYMTLEIRIEESPWKEPHLTRPFLYRGCSQTKSLLPFKPSGISGAHKDGSKTIPAIEQLRHSSTKLTKQT